MFGRTYIEVKNNKLTYCTFTPILCQTSRQYMIFKFDKEWEKYGSKTANFKIGEGQTTKIIFTGNNLVIPVLPNTSSIKFSLSYGNVSTNEIKLRCEPVRKYEELL